MNGQSGAALFATVALHHRMPWTLSNSSKFGANALKVHGKIFAALTRNSRLVLKLPPARADALIASRRAGRFASGRRLLKGWIVVEPNNQEAWVALSAEACKFVAGTPTTPTRET